MDILTDEVNADIRVEFPPNHKKCYACKWRGDLPGDAHSCCNHPLLEDNKNPMGELLGIMSKRVGAFPPMISQDIMDQFHIMANYHGIKMGWFNWPYNFDPVWLTRCDKFEEKEL